MSHRAPPRLSTGGGARWRGPAPAHPVPAAHGAAATTSRAASIAWLPSLLRKGPRPLRRADLCYRPQDARAACLHLIVLDTSGSMRRGGRLALAKGHAAMLIEQAARAGDQVALLCFGGQGVQWLLAPRAARLAGCARVRALGGGGGTPMAEALHQAGLLLRRASRTGSTPAAARHCLWLLTDGRTLEQPAAPAAARQMVIVDFDAAPPPLGRCADWAARWGAEYRRPLAAASR